MGVGEFLEKALGTAPVVGLEETDWDQVGLPGKRRPFRLSHVWAGSRQRKPAIAISPVVKKTVWA